MEIDAAKPIRLQPQRQLNCFIIMPFTSATFRDSENVEHTLNEKELKHIYEALFVKAITSYAKANVSFLNIHRSNAQRGNFVKDIVGKLQDYDLVIADLTGSNPNVFYELGIRHTLKNGTIMVTQNVSHLPSDLKNYIGVEYRYCKSAVDFDNYYPEFETKLHNLIDDVLADENKIDNPVRDFIGNKILFQNEDRIKDIEVNIQLMNCLKNKYSDILCYLSCQEKGYVTSERPSELLDLSLAQLAKAFLYKIVGSCRDTELIGFIDSLLLGAELIKHHTGSTDSYVYVAFRTNDYDFVTLDELIPYYEDVCTYYCESYFMDFEKIKSNEPMLLSFDYFINAWKRELESLTGN